MSSRIACSVCGAPNPEFAPRCAGCAAYLPTVSAGSSGEVAEPAPHASLVGQDVGPYHVVELVGAGATGVVYRATDTRLLRTVALKVLSEQLAPNERARGRMLREARAAARLRSRHVVQVLEHGVWEGRPYIAMEFLEGRTLRALLDERGHLPAGETARWIGQIAQGLEKAHAAGIVHRDLKPENVLLAHEDGGEVAKILDFGVAKAREAWADVAATHAGTLLGTPAYMSPEQANGARTLDHRSDLWSLGVIAFECLTGRRPFDREQLGALCVQILSEPLPVPSVLAPEVPPGFDAWWLRAAARDPAARFQTAAELSDALVEALATGAPVLADEASVAPRVAGGEAESGEAESGEVASEGEGARSLSPEAPMTASRDSVVPGRASRAPRARTGTLLAAVVAVLAFGGVWALSAWRAGAAVAPGASMGPVQAAAVLPGKSAGFTDSPGAASPNAVLPVPDSSAAVAPNGPVAATESSGAAPSGSAAAGRGSTPANAASPVGIQSVDSPPAGPSLAEAGAAGPKKAAGAAVVVAQSGARAGGGSSPAGPSEPSPSLPGNSPPSGAHEPVHAEEPAPGAQDPSLFNQRD